MCFADQHGVLALIRLPLGWGEPGQPHLLGILPDIKHWRHLYFCHTLHQRATKLSGLRSQNTLNQKTLSNRIWNNDLLSKRYKKGLLFHNLPFIMTMSSHHTCHLLCKCFNNTLNFASVVTATQHWGDVIVNTVSGYSSLWSRFSLPKMA